MPPPKVHAHKERILARGQIEALIASGHKLTIIDGKVLKLDAWLPYHPGGDKAIQHMVGKDATIEIRAFHSAETQRLMLRYQIGKVQDQWRDFTPPIQGGTFRTEKEQSLLLEGGALTGDTKIPGSSLTISSGETFGHAAEGTAPMPTTQAGPSTPTQNTTRAHRMQREVQRDKDLYPSLDHITQAKIVAQYLRLDQSLRDGGLYSCNYNAYFFEALRYVSLGLLSYFSLRMGWYAMSGVFLGMLWHQLSFTVHDAGHLAITHNFHIDSCIGIVFANFFGGLSCCWWKRNHNVHHIVTNSTEHDPDIQHMPFFAISHHFFYNLKSTFHERVMAYDDMAQFLIKYQHHLYYFILCFGRFNLYVLSWQHILLGQGPRKGPAWWHRYIEIAGQLFFWYWFGYLVICESIPTYTDRFIFVMIAHAITMPLHVQLTISHFAMSTADLGVAESFPQRMLRTTMDVECPAWLDFLHGGLQFQTVHHLFPRMPRHNLRKAHKLVTEFCETVNIPYAQYRFPEANGKVVSHLEEISRQARVLAECQRSITIQDVIGGH